MAGNKLKELLKSKVVRIFLLSLAALLLLLAVWKVFFRSESASVSYGQTELEAKLCRVLSDVDGVGSVTAMVTESEGTPVGAVVVFDGADNILTRMRVLDITSALLGLEKTKVQVYPARK